MSNKNYDYIFKILIVGIGTVGKTCFFGKFTDGSFNPNHYVTIGLDFKITMINIEGKKIKLQIWDTPGNDRFRTIVNTFYKGAHGIILMYDVTDKRSFNELNLFINNIKNYCNNNIKVVLVGNKCDSSDRVITEEEGKKFAEKYNIKFFETSAKTGQNINEVFQYILNEVFITNKGKEIINKNDYTKNKFNLESYKELENKYNEELYKNKLLIEENKKLKEIYNNTTLIQLEETKKLKNEINKLKDDLFKKNQIVSNYQKNEIKNIKNYPTNNNKENNNH